MQKSVGIIKVGSEILNYKNCYEVLVNNHKVELDVAALKNVYESFYFLK